MCIHVWYGVVSGILPISPSLFAFPYHLIVSAIISIPICYFSCSTHSPILSLFVAPLTLCIGIDKYSVCVCVCYANWTFNYQKRYKFCAAKEIIKCFWVQVAVVVRVHHRRHRHIIFCVYEVPYIQFWCVFHSFTCRQCYTAHKHTHAICAHLVLTHR